MTQRQRPPQRPVSHGHADGRERNAADWETLTERLIREAQEAGDFDDLPGHGRPLLLDDDSLAGDMALANHVMRNAGAAPPWIETDKEVRRSLDAIESLLAQASRSPVAARPRLERNLLELIEAHDDAVTRLDSLAPTARQQRTRLDRDALQTRLLQALGLISASE